MNTTSRREKNWGNDYALVDIAENDEREEKKKRCRLPTSLATEPSTRTYLIPFARLGGVVNVTGTILMLLVGSWLIVGKLDHGTTAQAIAIAVLVLLNALMMRKYLLRRPFSVEIVEGGSVVFHSVLGTERRHILDLKSIGKLRGQMLQINFTEGICVQLRTFPGLTNLIHDLQMINPNIESDI